jgi:vacuolar protein sorting-associated protein 13A/C
MLLFTTSGGSAPTSLALLTVDSPHILFSLPPVFALTEFFMGAFGTSDTVVDYTSEATKTLVGGKPAAEKPPLQFRIDFCDVSISVLEDDLDADSQAIRLTVAQISILQQARSPTYILCSLCLLLNLGNSCAHYDSSWNVLTTHGKPRRRSNLG